MHSAQKNTSPLGTRVARLILATALIAGTSTAALAQVNIGVHVGGPGYAPPPHRHYGPPPPPPGWRHRHWHRRHWHRPPPPPPGPGWR